MPRLKMAVTGLSDSDLHAVLTAERSVTALAARAARVTTAELMQGRPRALRAFRSVVTSSDTKRLSSIFQPLHKAVHGRFPGWLLDAPTTTDEGLRLLTRHFRTEVHPVAVVILAMMAEPAIHGPNLLDSQWESAMTLLDIKDDPDPAPHEMTIESAPETAAIETASTGTELEKLLARVAVARAQGGEVAMALRATADTIDSAWPASDSLDDLTGWFMDADHLMETVNDALGRRTESLGAAATALADEIRAAEDRAREATERAHRVEEHRRKEEDRRQLLLNTSAGLRELGFYDQAEALLANAGIEVSAVPQAPAGPPTEAHPEPLVESQAETLAETQPASPEESALDIEALPDVSPQAAEVEAPAEEPEPVILAGSPVSPWDEGDPPRIVALLLSEDYGLAWLLARAAGESRVRRQALHFFAASMGCDPAEAAAKQAAFAPDEADVGTASVDEARVLLAACLRFGLNSGYSPVGLQQLVDRASIEGETVQELVTTAVQAVHRGQTRPTGENASFPQVLEQWSDIARAAEQLRQTLLHRNIKFTRASRILHDLVKDGNELGTALTDIAQIAQMDLPTSGVPDERVKDLQRQAAQLHDRSRVRALIDIADARVSTKSQLRKEIVANARTRLEESIVEVRDFIEQAMSLHATIRQAEHGTNLTQLDGLRRAAGRYRVGDIRQVGSAALHQVALWIAAEPAPVGTHTLEGLEEHAARLIFEVDRDEHGRPSEPITPAQLDGALNGRSLSDAVYGHLARGNVALAIKVLDDVTDIEHDTALREACRQARRDLKQRHDTAVGTAESAIAKLRSVGRDEIAHGLQGRLDGLRATFTTRSDRFDLTMGRLDELLSDAHAELREYRKELRIRIDDVSHSPADNARIVALLDDGDEVTAEEFLTLLAAGQALPEDSAQPVDDDFAAFFPRIVNLAAEAESGDANNDVIARVTQKLPAGDSVSEIIRDGIASWRNLRQQKLSNSPGNLQRRRLIADILRMLGLVPAEGSYLGTLSDAPRTRSALYQVRAKPAGRSYVPQFGTQANGRYNVAIMWERATPGRLLSLIPDRLRTGPNIILYFGTLTAQQRLQLRNLSSPGRDTSSTVLLVDEAVIGWLASREEPDFRLTQRITLPFCSINPYTPFAGGDVPDEVFVGRDRERAEVESPTGSMFVYGGRQLGKSALLRRVEKLFTENTTRGSAGRQVALYLDLKSEGIGESHEPKELWALLNRHLRALDVLPSGLPANAGPAAVEAGIKRWLDRDGANRLLLLLDEADLFLTADFVPKAKDSKDAEGGARFQTLQRLKSLMESSDRRFKPVFAGLHQVQRFHDSANTPVAHGGTDILIGPLRPAEVRKLVAEPLRAIGYEFERNELVWRVAAFTNYQASLVQIFCEALVNHLRERPLSSSGGRVAITSEDIDAVYENRDVRNLIGQRFRWTINLDNRYRVIAIVVALLSSEAPAGTPFEPEDLRVYCEAYWPKAFSSEVLTRTEFIRYLDEMVGLGVLRRTGESYSMRSPNVVAMLGTRNALDQELREASVHFELPYEYNPTMTRAALPTTKRSGPRRSPLTDANIADLVGDSARNSGTTSRVLRAGARYSTAVVTGSPALGIERVAEALTIAAASKDQLTFEVVPLSDVPRVLIGGARGRHRFLLVECPPRQRQQFEADFGRAVRAVAASTIVRAIIVVNSAEYTLPAEYPANPDDELRLSLRRWSAEGLRAWHDFPFDNPHERRRLHQLTSGWPTLVENAVMLAAKGRSTEDVLDGLRLPFADADQAAAFLTETGLGENAAEATLWARYCTTVDTDTHRIDVEPVTQGDLEAIWGHDPDYLLNRMVSLEAVDQDPEGKGWLLDRIAAAALLHGVN
ncbi:hypothetical protein AB0C29_01495 [Actinoplanes sp. NPDC048791]|uniref:hypothetical protein n=1 Tax=Actinoplanes sp. NPDC048791 TaxID=3154623 RepID=UPI00340806AF